MNLLEEQIIEACQNLIKKGFNGYYSNEKYDGHLDYCEIRRTYFDKLKNLITKYNNNSNIRSK